MGKWYVLYTEQIWGRVELEVPDLEDEDDERDMVIDAFYNLPRPVQGIGMESELNDTEIDRMREDRKKVYTWVQIKQRRRKMQKLSEPALRAVKEDICRLLRWIEGFTESELYRDYQDAEGFTDAEWDCVIENLSSFAGYCGKEPE